MRLCHARRALARLATVAAFVVAVPAAVAHAEAAKPATPAADLFDHFPEIHSGQLRKVIDFIQAENKLMVDPDGFVRVRN